MRTPIKWIKNLNENKLTSEMLYYCIYSLNKRAKNCRDKKNEYRGYVRNSYFEKYQSKMEDYYKKKDYLIKKLLTPICIHKQLVGYKKVRVYDYDPDYKKLLRKQSKNIVWENCYFSYDEYRYVHFFDYEIKNSPIILYFLFYEMENGSFHLPIVEDEIKNWKLEVKSISSDFKTYGRDIGDLISVQFVDKVINKIKNGEIEKLVV